MRSLFFQALRILTFDYLFQKKNNTLVIFMFHQVNDKKKYFYPSMPVKTFKDICNYINSNYKVISPSFINEHFEKSNKPAAIVSFDDGHYDILEHAYPILKELNIPFNVNIDTEILDTGKPQDFVKVYDILNTTKIEDYYNSKYLSTPITINRSNPIVTENRFTNILSELDIKQKREFILDLAEVAKMNSQNYSKMLSKDDIKYLSSKGVEFGSHSHTHPILTKINDKELEFELKQSKQIIETLIQKEISVLAYPNGIWNQKVQETAKTIGYSIFLMTEDKINVIDKQKINDSYYRVNQYHNNLNEALAHTYGLSKYIKNLIK